MDTVTCSLSLRAVSVDLAAGTATGEGSDTVTTVENVIGSPFGDTLVGNRAANRLDGRGDNDGITAGVGDDSMIGGAGTDRCDGGTEIDTATACETVVGVP